MTQFTVEERKAFNPFRVHRKQNLLWTKNAGVTTNKINTGTLIKSLSSHDNTKFLAKFCSIPLSLFLAARIN